MRLFPKSVVIFGAGQVAQVMAAYLYDQKHAISAFIVDREHLPQGHAHPIPVSPFDEIGRYSPRTHTFVIGMSFRGLNAPRALKFAALRELGYEPLTFIHRDASVCCNDIGRGTFIMDENTIQPFAEIGDNVMLWSGNHVGHHSKVGNHVFVASHAVISGAVEIGERSFVGVNATIRDGVKIGARCVIGAGALILSDCEADGVYSPGGTERSRVPSNRLRGI